MSVVCHRHSLKSNQHRLSTSTRLSTREGHVRSSSRHCIWMHMEHKDFAAQEAQQYSAVLVAGLQKRPAAGVAYWTATRRQVRPCSSSTNTSFRTSDLSLPPTNHMRLPMSVAEWCARALNGQSGTTLSKFDVSISKQRTSLWKCEPLLPP